MKRLDINLEIVVRAPFLFPALAPDRFGFDRVAMRNRNGCLIIPQDQLRGVVRDMALRIAQMQDASGKLALCIEDLFGRGSDDARAVDVDSLAPHRTRIFFEDLVAENSERLMSFYPRLKINPESGAAERGHLLMLETSAQAGQDVSFTGCVTLFDEEPSAMLDVLNIAIGSIRQLGAYETIGFGRVATANCSAVPCAGVSSDEPILSRDAGRWSFQIDRPYLVNAKRVANNAFEGTRQISGAALKGCLIRNLELRGIDVAEYREQLAKVRIGFADVRGAVPAIPLSVAVNRKGDVVDLLGSPDESGRQAKDWKSKHTDLVKRSLRIADDIKLPVEERVHVKIDPSTGTAMSNMLFSTLAHDPYGVDFNCNIDTSAIKDTVLREAIEHCLRDGLFGLGKTGAKVISKAPLEMASREDWDLTWSDAARIALLVETPALLAAPGESSNAQDAYAKCWGRLVPGAKLIDYFAEQEFAGGYLARRFNSNCDGTAPFVLTKPGSVFLLGGERPVPDLIKKLVQDGVVSSDQLSAEPDWETCPFVPENGFGRLRVLWCDDSGGSA